jgi:type IV pilus assembly protein PilA
MIELMIVVAIIGVGATLAIPNYIDWNARTQLRQAASEVSSQLALARMAAMNRNTSVTVTISTVSGHLSLSAAETASSKSVLPLQTWANSVTGVVGSPVTVVFSSLGRRFNGGTTNQDLGITNSRGQQYTVRILPSGRTKWCGSSAWSCG